MGELESADVLCWLAKRATIAAVFAAALTVSSSAQEFMADAGAPADAFPNPDRPVAHIVSPIWHDEKERDAAGEPRQLVRLLGIKRPPHCRRLAGKDHSIPSACRLASKPLPLPTSLEKGECQVRRLTSRCNTAQD
jgi:hypothetical protein